MKNRVLKFLTLGAALCGMSTWAGVAKVGTTEYDVFADALADWGPGKTLELLEDVTTTSTFKLEVNASKSNQNWVLNLGDHKWTASGCNAINLYAAGGTLMNQNYGLKISANEAGGIVANGKYCVEVTYDTANTAYRPRLQFCGGHYVGSYVVYYKSLTFNNTSVGNGPATLFQVGPDGTEPVFDGSMALAKSPVTVDAGVFNGSTFNTYPVSSYAVTTINGGKFKTIPSNSSKKAVTYGCVFLFDGTYYQGVKKSTMEWQAKVASSSVVSILTSSYGYTDGFVYFTSADYAISKYNSVTLNAGVSATQAKKVSSGTFTLDASAGADYSGDVTLSGSTAKFVLVLPTDKAYSGSVSAGTAAIHLTRAEADGIVTWTYSRASAVSDANAVAKIDGVNYASLEDALYAVDGTSGKVITLVKDVAGAYMVTQGGTTRATVDLNGHSFKLSGISAGTGADVELSVVDTSVDKSGRVTNSAADFMVIAFKTLLAGDWDYNGAYTLLVKGGTWNVNPADFSYGDVNFGFVPEGYESVDNGNGTWTVGQVIPEVRVEEGTVVARDPAGAALSGSAAEVAAAQQAQVVSAMPVTDIRNTGVRNVPVNDAVLEALRGVAETEELKAAVTATCDIQKYVNIQLTAVEVTPTPAPGALNALAYEVKPMVEARIVVDGVESVLRAQIPNGEITSPITFRLPLTDAFTACVKVVHAGDDDRYPAIETENGSKFVTVAADHFSVFTVYPSATVATKVVSSNIMAIKRVPGATTSEVVAAVPWKALLTKADISVGKLIVTGVSVGDTISAWEEGVKGYYVWRWTGTEWESAKDAKTGVTAPSAAEYVLRRGQAVWYKQAGGAKPYSQIGDYVADSVTTPTENGEPTVVANNLLINPYYKDIELTKLTGCVEGDTIHVFDTGKVYTYKTLKNATAPAWTIRTRAVVDTPFGPVSQLTDKVVDSVPVPAGVGFWYISKGGAPTIDWKALAVDTTGGE